MNVGKRLKELRELKGMTVNKLSNASGLSQSYVREIERENKQPTVESLSCLCFALGISLQDFFDDACMDSIRNDPLLREVYRLTGSQRELLRSFLQSLHETPHPSAD